VRSIAAISVFVVAAFFGTQARAYDRAKVSPDAKGAAVAKADAGHEAAHGEGHGHAQRLYGHPQPEGPIQWDPWLFLFTLVLFLLLLYLLNQYAWQPILFHLAERDRRIDEAVRQAEISREEMQRLSLQTDKDLAAAHEEVRKMLDQVRAEASKDADDMLARAKEEAAAERTQALAAVERAKSEAQDSLREASVGLAAQMAGKIANRNIDTAQVRKYSAEG
jgi:F-type H+-transporting ATPase subunit b